MKINLRIIAVVLVLSLHSQAQTMVGAKPANIPPASTFYYISDQLPPLPFNLYPGVPAYPITNGIYLVDDSSVTAAKQTLSEMSTSPGPYDSDSLNTDGSGIGGYPPLGPVFDTNGLWIQLNSVTIGAANLTLHNTTNRYYGLLTQTNLANPFYNSAPGWFYYNGQWYFFTGLISSSGQNTVISPVPTFGNQTMYFRAVSVLGEIYFSTTSAAAVRPNSATNAGTPVSTTVRFGTSPPPATPTAINYQFSGSAMNGIDYSNLTGTITIPAGAYESSPITINPLYATNAFDFINGSPVSAVLTLSIVSSNGPACWPEPGYLCFTSTIATAPLPYTNIATLPYTFPTGITYASALNSLVVSVNDVALGNPFNFVGVSTDYLGATTITTGYWQGIAGIPGEVEMTTIKTTTNNFNLGVSYFGNNGGYYRNSAQGCYVATMPANGSFQNQSQIMTWCFLTNYVGGASMSVVGIYSDDTGVFSNNLVVVTDVGEVWVIGCDNKGNAIPTLLTIIPRTSSQLYSGCITLPNNPAKWGPWAGKIITADDQLQPDPTAGDILAIDTNGIVTTFDTASILPYKIAVDCFALIHTNQNLYCVDASNEHLLKFSGSDLAAYDGDLIMTSTSTAERSFNYGPFYIVAWDSSKSCFKARLVPTPGILEDCVIAPIDFPSQ